MTQGPETASPMPRYLLMAAAVVALGAVGARIYTDRAPVSVAKTEEMPKDVNAAIAQLETRLQKEPDDAAGWRMLGMALAQTGKFGEASQALKRATQLDPKNADMWATLGATLVSGGNGSFSPEANDAIAKALAIDPNEPLARYYKGIGLDVAGNHKAAIDEWLAMLESGPANAEWRSDYIQAVENVAAKYKIDVAARLSKLPDNAPGKGAQVAAQGIPGPSRADMQQARNMPKGQQEAMVQGMVEGLEAKLKANPKNLEGWIMLMRSRTTLGETAKAAKALADGKAAFAGDAAAVDQLEDAARVLGISA